MMSENNMHVSVYSLGKTLYEGTVASATLPAEDGVIGILPHHVPLMTALKSGQMAVHTETGEQTFSIAGGFAYTDGKYLVVLAD